MIFDSYKYKIFIPSVWGNLSKDFIGGSYSNICIAKPKDVCTESYVESGNFDNFTLSKLILIENVPKNPGEIVAGIVMLMFVIAGFEKI